ncbi:MAG: aminotransferase, partial [Phaeodactylibacter sp.]|nr:aminotransferase [Phaeodactylibacter sp.]
MMTTEQIARYRTDTPACEQLAHFNNAGAALVPTAVSPAIDQQLQLEARIGGYEAMQAVTDATERFYTLGAQLLNAAPHQIAYTTSATDAYNRALTAIPFAAGDVILTTNHDYV